MINQNINMDSIILVWLVFFISCRVSKGPRKANVDVDDNRQSTRREICSFTVV